MKSDGLRSKRMLALLAIAGVLFVVEFGWNWITRDAEPAPPPAQETKSRFLVPNQPERVR